MLTCEITYVILFEILCVHEWSHYEFFTYFSFVKSHKSRTYLTNALNNSLIDHIKHRQNITQAIQAGQVIIISVSRKFYLSVSRPRADFSAFLYIMPTNILRWISKPNPDKSCGHWQLNGTRSKNSNRNKIKTP